MSFIIYRKMSIKQNKILIEKQKDIEKYNLDIIRIINYMKDNKNKWITITELRDNIRFNGLDSNVLIILKLLNKIGIIEIATFREMYQKKHKIRITKYCYKET